MLDSTLIWRCGAKSKPKKCQIMKLLTLLCIYSLSEFAVFQTSATEIIYNNFNNSTNLTRNGSATVTQTSDGAVMRIVSAVVGQNGNFFINQPANASTFSARFVFRITNPGAVANANYPGENFPRVRRDEFHESRKFGNLETSQGLVYLVPPIL